MVGDPGPAWGPCCQQRDNQVTWGRVTPHLGLPGTISYPRNSSDLEKPQVLVTCFGAWSGDCAGRGLGHSWGPGTHRGLPPRGSLLGPSRAHLIPERLAACQDEGMWACMPSRAPNVRHPLAKEVQVPKKAAKSLPGGCPSAKGIN